MKTDPNDPVFIEQRLQRAKERLKKFDELITERDKLKAENELLATQVALWTERAWDVRAILEAYRTNIFCSYCNKTIIEQKTADLLPEQGAEAIRQHVSICGKNPLVQERDALKVYEGELDATAELLHARTHEGKLKAIGLREVAELVRRVLDERDALEAELAEAKKIFDKLPIVIKETVDNYRCKNTLDDEMDGVPLVDMLCPPGYSDLAEGKEEIECLVDSLVAHIHDYMLEAGKAGLNPEAVGEAVAGRFTKGPRCPRQSGKGKGKKP